MSWLTKGPSECDPSDVQQWVCSSADFKHWQTKKKIQYKSKSFKSCHCNSWLFHNSILLSIRYYISLEVSDDSFVKLARNLLLQNVSTVSIHFVLPFRIIFDIEKLNEVAKVKTWYANIYKIASKWFRIKIWQIITFSESYTYTFQLVFDNKTTSIGQFDFGRNVCQSSYKKLLPRNCPRICIASQQSWVRTYLEKPKKTFRLFQPINSLFITIYIKAQNILSESPLIAH